MLAHQSNMSATNPNQVFKTHIWRNPEVCNNCFSRCKEIEKRHYHDDNTRAEREVNESNRTDDGIIGYDTYVPENKSPEKRTYRPRITCERCGSVGLLADDETLSKQVLKRRASRIADRLEEDGLDVDRAYMQKWVNVTKYVSVFDGYDREILAGAVEFALLKS